jgi:hypothetical protein
MNDRWPLARREAVTLEFRASHIPHCTTLFFTRWAFLNYRGQFGGCWRPEGTYRRCPSCILSPNKPTRDQAARGSARTSCQPCFCSPFKATTPLLAKALSLSCSENCSVWRGVSGSLANPLHRLARPQGCQHLHHPSSPDDGRRLQHNCVSTTLI